MFASSILTARRDIWPLYSPSQVRFCPSGIGGDARAMIDKMAPPDVMTGRSCYDGADGHYWIGVHEEIQDLSVWAAQLG